MNETGSYGYETGNKTGGAGYGTSEAGYGTSGAGYGTSGAGNAANGAGSGKIPMTGQEKAIAVLAYFDIILAVIAYFIRGNNERVLFHINQGLLIGIARTVLSVLCGGMFFMPIVKHSPVIWTIGQFLPLITLAAWVFGLINVLKDRDRELPLIGKYRIIK